MSEQSAGWATVIRTDTGEVSVLPANEPVGDRPFEVLYMGSREECRAHARTFGDQYVEAPA